MPSTPPDGLPTYRLLTGRDDAAFRQRASESLDGGYALHGSPGIAFNGEHDLVAQALVWRGDEQIPPRSPD